MFFFFRKKPIELRFLTEEDGVVEIASPKPLSQNIPQWWKDTPSYLDPKTYRNSDKAPPSEKIRAMLMPKKLNKSVKHCWSIQEVFKRGIGFPMWKDLFVTVDDSGKAHRYVPGGASPNAVGDQHPEAQYPGLLDDHWDNFKFTSPWMTYTEEFVPFYMTHPFYHWKNPSFQTMPGVIEFYHQHTSNINTILKRPEKVEGKVVGMEHEFRVNDIMAYFIPMTDRPIVIKAEQITPREKEKLKFGQKMFMSAATTARKNNWGGCPFHVGKGK